MTSTPDASKQRFNAEAAAWDTQPAVLEATRQAFEALQPLIRSFTAKKGSNLDVLEFGCGTGLLSMQVAPLVTEIVAIDLAEGMVDMLRAKLEKPDSPKNIIPICKLLMDPEDPILPPADVNNPRGSRKKFDLITSHLVLHHVPDLRPFLRTLIGCLKPGGRVALTDYEDFGEQAKKFHPKEKWDTCERHGIQREWMEGLMKEIGFTEVNVRVAWTLKKDVERWQEGDEDIMDFPFLICEGARP
ncbi:Methyltransferase domain protein [Aspergillus sclerotialis]|uniref:Methyltransferase domain protein n=1 Tax=Aspergillus sclerotialis TaxID=2070753 RepID=A0A3A2ZFM7_9EURO|nr:Methyltransferase domain protein [Aspergillus sclerotialis]